MKENLPEGHLSAFEGSAAPKPDLTEPDDLIAALDAWDPDDSAAPEVDASEEEMDHVYPMPVACPIMLFNKSMMGFAL